MWCWKKEPPLIPDKSLSSVADFILSEKCSKIVTMAGAGISTAAGIPDFRTPSAGFYMQLTSLNLPYPEAVFELKYFCQNPAPFFRLCKDMYPKLKANPTLTHYFIKLIDNKGLLLRHYTQNVDGLEKKAGLEADKLMEAHGTFETGHCLNCKREYKLSWMENFILSDLVPKCTVCGHVVKPDVVLYGEGIPNKVITKCKSDFGSCDLLLIFGTSLSVEPFGSLPRLVRKRCPRVLINRLPVQKRSFRYRDPNSRDIAWFGDCDEGCSSLARFLRWENDLANLMKRKI